MPLTLNSFSFEDSRGVIRVLRRMKAHQRKRITVVTFESRRLYRIDDLKHGFFNKVNPLTFLPGLKEFRVRVFSVPSLDEMEMQQTEHQVQQVLAHGFKGTSVDVNVEQTTLNWLSYDDA
jgi:hypothetical protein